MNPARRRYLMLLAAPAFARAQVQRGRELQFPRDHGAHLESHTEWWYATGWLGSEATPTHGMQITFFRSRTGLAQNNPSRFAARQLLFAHAAVLRVGDGRHLHDQRIERWSGQASAGSSAALDGGAVRLGGWSMHDDGRAWLARAQGAEFAFDLTLARTQLLLLQGDAGFSRKGPQEDQASHYYSEPQLAVSGRLTFGGTVQGNTTQTQGRAWLDHEWSDTLLHPEAVGWDWMGINLFDGSALTAFVLRRRDGTPLWAGGSWRAPGQASRSFAPDELRLTPGRTWRSPASGAVYPVQWQLQTPAGSFTLRALADAQELDSRASVGAIYWEGLSELRDAQDRRVGLGYLEMTGYAQPIRL